MKKVLFFSMLFLISGKLLSQILEKYNLTYNNAKYNVFIFKSDSSSSNLIKVIENNQLKTQKALFETLETDGKFFAINAGIVDFVCNLLGLFINHSQEVHAINTNTGVGNFYLQPNGFVAFTAKGDVTVKSTQEYNNKGEYTCATQSGPMLTTNSSINNQFNKNSKNLNFRVGVGTYEKKSEKYVIFAISNEKVSFYEFASLFLNKFKCKNALNIESGDLCSMHLPNHKRVYSDTKIVCKYFYFKL